MKINIFLISVLVSLILLITSCKDKEPEPTIVSPSPPKVYDDAYLFSAKDFPVKVGNWWVYKVSAISWKDTIKVEIIGVTDTDSSKLYHCITTRKNNIIDSSYLEYSDKFIRYQRKVSNHYSYFGEFYFRFPFKPKKVWTWQHPKDGMRVISQYRGANALLGKSFEAFYVKREWLMQASSFVRLQNYKVCKGVGIISQNIYTNDMWYQQEDFTLIAFHLE